MEFFNFSIFKFFNRKRLLILLITIIIILVGAFLYNKYKTSKLTPEQLKQIQRQQEIQAQLEMLKKLREEVGYKPPTQQEIKQQLNTLKTIRKEMNYKPPTQEEIAKQLEELKKLREQSQ